MPRPLRKKPNKENVRRSPRNQDTAEQAKPPRSPRNQETMEHAKSPRYGRRKSTRRLSSAPLVFDGLIDGLSPIKKSTVPEEEDIAHSASDSEVFDLDSFLLLPRKSKSKVATTVDRSDGAKNRTKRTRGAITKSRSSRPTKKAKVVEPKVDESRAKRHFDDIDDFQLVEEQV
ncbi:hypothetical protein GGI25_000615 [Coemansia spiralis]|uniref:Uncharacterized protein n=2 Tax=Coemansia TaxID=4863 RepID=A0A9W8G809_9FUNG|nr:hypothetical protein BX070DRAFT_254303 [Coemansia spiralis]KAJ1996072.1 hypothetical protein EDC05_000440 [Coemansia umbellata]KAJ2625515.1 hypothetical protein GGI26_000655 [Coemansia sp. RSA 1358]KAJ2680642.1 hypothetical protein GGI25_000615 [Coemansia spiralis]